MLGSRQPRSGNNGHRVVGPQVARVPSLSRDHPVARLPVRLAVTPLAILFVSPSPVSSALPSASSPAGSPDPGLPAPGAEEPLLLEQRLGRDPQAAVGAAPLLLPLTAQERTSLRGRRASASGRALLLQLPRGAALEPGEWLGGSGGVRVRVEAAPEPLLRVRAADPLALLQAAYHLGNRHVALELHPGELRLLQDSVLAELLRHRGLELEALQAPFQPEAGAYGGGPHQHHHHSHA